jgi:SulP family sulfate permease
LTVVFDLTIAIEIGLLLALLLFLRRVMENTQIKVFSDQIDLAEGTENTTHEILHVNHGVEIYEIDGPFFFGVANKFEDLMRAMGEKPQVRIIRMRRVPFIDSTGIHNLETLINASKKDGIHVVLSGVVPSVKDVLLHAHIDRLIGEDHICDNITEAVTLANSIAVE